MKQPKSDSHRVVSAPEPMPAHQELPQAYGDTVLRGRYRLGELIGSGGLAGVYRAHDEFLGRDVAVKIFRATATAEADFQRQEEEVNVLAKLSHPNLVTLLDAAVERSDPANPRIYYVMELVEGADLQQRLDKGALTARQIAQLGYYVASALELVHHRGIVHRDIKPSNILLASYLGDETRMVVKLTDFGIASVGDVAPIPENAVVTGTVAYLSPEQATGSIVGGASDIYSLGLVLLQCFTHRLAFPGPPQHSALARTLDDPEIPDAVPTDWHPLLAAMTARVPGDRPDAHEVSLALREHFTSELGRHRAPETGPTTTAPSVNADAASGDPVQSASSHDASAVSQRGDTPSDDTAETDVPHGPDGAFERIASLAARVLEAPVAVVQLEGEDRIWHWADREIDTKDVISGLWSTSISREWPWVIEDARSDPRTKGSALVTGDFGLQFVAGVPLRSAHPNGAAGILGTLSVLGFEPRTVTQSQITTLEDLGAMVVRDLELRFAGGPQGSQPAITIPQPQAEKNGESDFQV